MKCRVFFFVGLLHLCANNQRGWAMANASRWSCGFGSAKEKLGFGHVRGVGQ